MNDCRIEEVGTAVHIYDRPATPFVFDFIGDSSALPVLVDKGHVFLDDRVLALDATGQPDGPATLFFRPNHIRLIHAESIVGVITAARRIGDIKRLELEAGLARYGFQIDVPNDAEAPSSGRVAIQPTKWRLFSRLIQS